MVEDNYGIQFSYEGTEYEGQVWPDYDGQDNAIFQVIFHPASDPHKSNIVFLKSSENGKWVNEKTNNDIEVPDGLIETIAKEIELKDA